MTAIERVTADKRFHTPDLGGTGAYGGRDEGRDRGNPRRERLNQISVVST